MHRRWASVRNELGTTRERPLETGEQFDETGIYAHADPRHVCELDGEWKQFTSACGLQNHNEGSVVFVVARDGDEKARSELIRDWLEGLVNVDATGVDQLERIVGNRRDGEPGDCGVWFPPMLTR